MINKINGNLIIISGPSGSGKGTICQSLSRERDDLRISVSATSRSPRGDEQHGREYYFLSREQFEIMIGQEQLLEWADVYGNYYGTPSQPVLELLEQGIDVVLEIDVQGALQVKSKYPEGVLIFIIPPTRAELAKRLRNRGLESDADIEHRLQWVPKELAEIHKYDYLVINDDLGEAVRQVIAILTAQKCQARLFDLDSFLASY